MLKIAICDDNLIFLDEMRLQISKWAEENNIPIKILLFDNGDAMVDYQKSEPVDIILLDILMPFFNGMDTAKEIRKSNNVVKIIFLTSAPEYAVESYDVKASGYLLKPIDSNKLVNTINDCYVALKKEFDSLVIKTVVGYQKVYVNNIEYIEAQNRKTIFVLNDGRVIEALDTFSSFNETLTVEKGFFKCHRSYLISIGNVDSFNSMEIVTRSGARIPIARGYGKPFKEAYFEYMFNKADREGMTND